MSLTERLSEEPGGSKDLLGSLTPVERWIVYNINRMTSIAEKLIDTKFTCKWEEIGLNDDQIGYIEQAFSLYMKLPDDHSIKKSIFTLDSTKELYGCFHLYFIGMREPFQISIKKSKNGLPEINV